MIFFAILRVAIEKMGGVLFESIFFRKNENFYGDEVFDFQGVIIDFLGNFFICFFLFDEVNSIFLFFNGWWKVVFSFLLGGGKLFFLFDG